jgi:tetratricopeptide (TPR) repeat protein
LARLLAVSEKAGQLMRRPALIAFALLSGCFALAVTVEPELATTKPYLRHEQTPVEVILGDARRFFARHFFVKADIYFHSGYYPSIFDDTSEHHDSHIATDADAMAAHHEEGEDHEDDFLGKPLDLFDQFSRSFYPSMHTHLDEDHAGGGLDSGKDKIREMLPWLRMTAALDPNRIETYTVGSYWLRTRMGKAQQAESFLREGLEANPGSYAILFELGRIYNESYKDSDRARNLWEAALKHWNQTESTKENPDTFLLLQITWHLALVEQQTGHTEKAIAYLETAKTVSPIPDQVQKRIDELRTTAK